MDNKPPKIEVIKSYKNHIVIRDSATGYIWLYNENKEIAYYTGCHVIECKKKLTPLEKYYVQDFRQLIYDLY